MMASYLYMIQNWVILIYHTPNILYKLLYGGHEDSESNLALYIMVLWLQHIITTLNNMCRLFWSVLLLWCWLDWLGIWIRVYFKHIFKRLFEGDDTLFKNDRCRIKGVGEGIACGDVGYGVKKVGSRKMNGEKVANVKNHKKAGFWI